MTYVPWASSATTRKAMQANRRRDTRPEMLIRRACHAYGLRYGVDRRPECSLPCKADMVFPTERVVVFVDGCFWHGCSEHRTIPVMNRTYWTEKIDRTWRRDRRNDAALADMGWIVLRFWEHDDASRAALAVRDAVLRARSATRTTLTLLEVTNENTRPLRD